MPRVVYERDVPDTVVVHENSEDGFGAGAVMGLLAVLLIALLLAFFVFGNSLFGGSTSAPATAPASGPNITVNPPAPNITINPPANSAPVSPPATSPGTGQANPGG
ncbi:MAG: hypothetical protein HY329_21805 [Chloroflexi bacterium]|nr:hypothetical protein [Chloroflexota bacterium]